MHPSLQRDLPEVPISVFKANPIAYATTGALVMVHNRPRLRVLPVIDANTPSIADAKARLHLLNSLLDPALADEERLELARGRDADLLDEPQ